jgi:2-oxoglutarate ferredoxin oxidoreductase subunit beta
MPHIWCPGCGIGTALNCFVRAIDSLKAPTESYALVSGIGCTGRLSGYMRMDTFHTTHGRAIPFATGLRLVRPETKVIVFSGDGDLTAIGGNHFIHAARRNHDLTVICVNNFNYGMTGGQVAPTTPLCAKTSTTVLGNIDAPFNLPLLASASGATFVARWTTFHIRQLQRAMAQAIEKKGFSFLEIVSPCPTLFGRRNKMKEGLVQMKQFKERAVVCNGADPREAEISMDSPIVVGTFLDIERPTYEDRLQAMTA